MIKNKILLGNCLEIMSKEINNESVDLVVTSPPYNVGMDYGDYDDNMPWDTYYNWCYIWLEEIYRILKKDGRFCLNHYLSLGKPDNRHSPLMDLNWIAVRKVGFKHHGLAIWNEKTLAKRTAWGCYDEKTKVLTDNGLKYFKDVNLEKDKFATINKITKKVEYQKAFEFIEKEYVGEMYHLKSRTFDLKITPNHQMFLTNHSKKNLFFESMENCSSKTLLIPQCFSEKSNKEQKFFELPSIEFGKRTKKKYFSNSVSRKISMENWLKFLGIYLTDGGVQYDTKRGRYVVSIYQTKVHIRKQIKDLLDQLPFKYRFKKQKDEFVICNKQLAHFLNQFGIKKERKFPKFIFELSTFQKQVFLDWVWKGDGSFNKNGEKRYIAMASENFYHGLINLLLQLGYGFSHYLQQVKPRIYKGKLFKANLVLHRITIKKSQIYVLRKNGNIKKQFYSGKIYCVSVPNKTLFVERNGRFTWCGNSWLEASAPYINSPLEGVLILYKDQWKKKRKGETTISKKDFMMGTSGVWELSSGRRIKEEICSFPPALPALCINLLSYRGDLILDPFNGWGNTTTQAKKLHRNFIGIELSPKRHQYSLQKIKQEVL